MMSEICKVSLKSAFAEMPADSPGEEWKGSHFRTGGGGGEGGSDKQGSLMKQCSHQWTDFLVAIQVP